ncbi:MAG: hypothetical protein Q7S60_04835 [bacterium]|nr:hypothetical protein [bacterium]
MVASAERKRLHTPVSERLPFLRDIWDMQIKELMRHGFHDILGMSKWEYTRTLPKMPRFYPGGMVEAFREQPLFFPIIVDGRVPYRQKITLLNAQNDENYLGTVRDEEGAHLPELETYVLWVQDGILYLGLSADEARGQMKPNEGGLTVFKGIDMGLVSPYGRYHTVELIGSYVARESRLGIKSQVHPQMSPQGNIRNSLHRSRTRARNNGIATVWVEENKAA